MSSTRKQIPNFLGKDKQLLTTGFPNLRCNDGRGLMEVDHQSSQSTSTEQSLPIAKSGILQQIGRCQKPVTHRTKPFGMNQHDQLHGYQRPLYPIIRDFIFVNFRSRTNCKSSSLRITRALATSSRIESLLHSRSTQSNSDERIPYCFLIVVFIRNRIPRRSTGFSWC